jgi:zinc/manganese transport system substrate-binding protein
MTLSAFLIGACGGSGGGAADSGVDVVATTTILADVAMNVVGEEGVVEALLPVGADPHDYQPSSRQVALIQNADLVIANGLGLEEGLGDVLEAAATDGANIVYLGDRLDPIQFGIEAAEADDHRDEDPHVWLDPIRMAEAGRVIAAELALIEAAASWSDRADEYAAELLAADQEIQEILAVVPAGGRKLVVNHQSLGYFADRYGFEVIGSVVPGGATLGDPSSAELSALVETIEAEDVPAIFAETTEPAALAEAVAAEVGQGVAIVSLYTGSLGESDSGADTLIGMLKTNAELIAEALS